MDSVATANGRNSPERDDARPDDGTAMDGGAPESTTDGEPREDNKFQAAIAAWRNMDLTNLIPSLDTVASELVGQQRDGLTQRKDLAQKTKGFKRLDDAHKLGEIRGLLKAYQTFIDALTTQSKTVSAAFFQVYSPLSEAPDPYPLLEASVDSLMAAEETVPRLADENERLQASVTTLTSQLEDAERFLDEERSTRQSLERSMESKVRDVETSWSAVLDEKRDNWEAKEKALEERTENQDRLLRELKANYEVAQRLGRGDEGDAGSARGGATAAELEIVSTELDRTSMRLAEVEARNEQLRVELARSASQSTPTPSATVEEDPSFLRLRSENASLLRKLEAAKRERESEKARRQGDLRGLEREVSALKGDRDMLREKVQRWSDYDGVRQELEVLKSIEFSIDDEEDAERERAGESGHGATTQNGVPATGKADTLEQLLLARNKKLGDELTLLRVSHRDLQDRLTAMQEELSEAKMERERSRTLTASLESDLERVQQEAANAFPPAAMSVAGTYAPRYAQTSYGARRGRSSPTSSIISGFDPQGTQGATEGARAGESPGPGGGGGILPMITAQRDRFKTKNAELENELARTYGTVSSLRTEVASLQKDNLGLYEKTRYVSTFNRHPPTASPRYASNPSRATVSSADTSSGRSLDRYRSAYEQNISPFAAFRGRESARAFRRMSWPERVVYQITRVVLATRTSRNLFAAYCLALHLLVLGMLYWLGTGNIDRQVSNLSENVAAAGAAGAGVAGGDDRHEHTGDWVQEGFNDG